MARKRTLTEFIHWFLRADKVLGPILAEFAKAVWPTRENIQPVDAVQVKTETTGFDGMLSAQEDNVQKALDKLDDHQHDNLYYSETETDTLLSGKSNTSHTHDERYYTETEVDNKLTQKANDEHHHDLSYAAVSHAHDDRYFTEDEINTLLSGKSDTGHLHDDRYYTETEVDNKLAQKADDEHHHDLSYAAVSHNHDDSYLTEDEINTLLSGKSDTGHLHDNRYYTETEVDNKLAQKADDEHHHDLSYAAFSHTHDDRYYTETEIDNKLAQKAETAHHHGTDYAALSHTHDSSYYTKPEVNNLLVGVEFTIAGLTNEASVVSSDYLVFHDNTVGGMRKTQIGNLPFYTETEVDNKLTQKAEAAHHHDTDYAALSHTHDSRYYTESEINSKLSLKADTSHNHDSRYYTESEVNTQLAGKSNSGHLHDDRYYTETEVNNKLSGKSDTTHHHDSDYAALAHIHDDRYLRDDEIATLLGGKSDNGHAHDSRYYTESEVENLLSAKADNGHTHNEEPAVHTHDDRYFTESETQNLLYNLKIGDLANVNTYNWQEGKVLKFNSSGDLVVSSDEILETYFTGSATYGQHILSDYWDCKIYARVEAFIYTPFQHAHFATKAAYVSLEYNDGAFARNEVDVISSASISGSPLITIEAVDSGNYMYFRVVLSGCNTNYDYKIQVFVTWFLKDTSESFIPM